MKILFISNPMESFKTYKDSTYVMMREVMMFLFSIMV